ncbi:MAG: phenylacetate--CoA ligase, partial [Eubacteriales bacterium]
MERYWQADIERATPADMRAMQSAALRKTLAHIYERVAPYRERMQAAGVRPEDIRSIDDLSKLPFTEKKDLRDYYPYGLFACPMEQVVRIHASSGTTGKQIVVGYTKADLDAWG